MMSHRERGLFYVAISGVALAVLIELAMGRTAFCRCGSIRLWSGDPWGPENSQQLTDAYTFTHITHGVLVYGLLELLGRRLSLGARGVLAVAIESSWKVLENTDWIIGPGREGPTLESIFSQPVRRGTIYLVGWLASLSGSWLDGSSGVRTIRAPTSLWLRAPGTCWLGTPHRWDESSSCDASLRDSRFRSRNRDTGKILEPLVRSPIVRWGVWAGSFLRSCSSPWVVSHWRGIRFFGFRATTSGSPARRFKPGCRCPSSGEYRSFWPNCARSTQSGTEP